MVRLRPFFLSLFYTLYLRLLPTPGFLVEPVIVVDVFGATFSPIASLGDPPYHFEEPGVDSLVARGS